MAPGPTLPSTTAWLLLIAGLVVVAALALGGRSGRDEPALTASAPAAIPEARADELFGSHARPDILPGPGEIFAGGDSVPFKVCSRTTGWSRPSQESMVSAFTSRRLGDGELPFPLNYAYYLEDVYYVTNPHANAANIEWSAFSGFGVGPGREQSFCNEPDIRALVARYGAPGKLSAPFFQDLQLVGYHAVAMKRLGPNLVVQVAPAPHTHEVAYFPYPADPGFFDSSLGFDTLQVVDSSGTLLHAEGRIPFANWFERFSYDDSGQLDVAVLAGESPIISTDLRVPADQPPLTLYWGLGLPLRAAPAGTLTALDQDGDVLLTAGWQATDIIWQPLARLRLPPETFRLQIDTIGGDPATPYRHFVLIREGLPLPMTSANPSAQAP